MPTAPKHLLQLGGDCSHSKRLVLAALQKGKQGMQPRISRGPKLSLLRNSICTASAARDRSPNNTKQLRIVIVRLRLMITRFSPSFDQILLVHETASCQSAQATRDEAADTS